MAPKFGTSGLRGRVVDLNPDLVAEYVRAFVSACDIGTGLFVGQDLRPSSPAIADDVLKAARGMGVDVAECGAVPTPALALAAREAGAGAVMITGSHIPADRNGLKFYSTKGEITKEDEAAITGALGTNPTGTNSTGTKGARIAAPDAGAAFVARYLTACGTDGLHGQRIGVYQHSAVGRDILVGILSGMGADVVELGRSDIFIPVDTEAVDPGTRAQIAGWVTEYGLDALVSTDGDSDRPLLADERGQIVPGDIMGQITAQALGADAVITPISSNGGVVQKAFPRVERTRIGSPYVIAGMEAAGGKVVGYEANGGFLLGFAAQGPAGTFSALPTRDCVLPLVMTLLSAGAGPLSARVAQEPPVVTLADRLQEVPQERSQPFIKALIEDRARRQAFLATLGGEEAGLDLTDGVRMRLKDGRVVHVRPSGNAPELRLYVEAPDLAGARALMATGLDTLRRAMSEPA